MMVASTNNNDTEPDLRRLTSDRKQLDVQRVSGGRGFRSELPSTVSCREWRSADRDSKASIRLKLRSPPDYLCPSIEFTTRDPAGSPATGQES